MMEVAAVLIMRKERFMVCRRPAGKARALLWEFAGGKLEPGETMGVFMEVVHAYPDVTIHMTVYRAAITQGEPQCLEHSEIRFITADEAENYAFCPADQAVVGRLKSL